MSFIKRTPTIVPDLPPEGSGYLATLKAVKRRYLCVFATEQPPVAKGQRDDASTSLIYKTAFLLNKKMGSFM
ncbi:hypothetical protein KVMX100_120044 [Klebsiella variicola]|nr:hypothetical protein KVMX100_120044 [Klebsiella variicola]